MNPHEQARDLVELAETEMRNGDFSGALRTCDSAIHLLRMAKEDIRERRDIYKEYDNPVSQRYDQKTSASLQLLEDQKRRIIAAAERAIREDEPKAHSSSYEQRTQAEEFEGFESSSEEEESVAWGEDEDEAEEPEQSSHQAEQSEPASIPRQSNSIFVIPEGTETVSALEQFKTADSVQIPSSVTFIDEHAFAGCTNLKEITIPDSVEDVGPQAFAEWGKDQTISVNKRNSKEWHKKWDKDCKAKIIYRK